MRDNDKTCMIVQDSLTGEIIITIPYKYLNYTTINNIIADIMLEDVIDKHGFNLKYGIRN